MIGRYIVVRSATGRSTTQMRAFSPQESRRTIILRPTAAQEQAVVGETPDLTGRVSTGWPKLQIDSINIRQCDNNSAATLTNRIVTVSRPTSSTRQVLRYHASIVALRRIALIANISNASYSGGSVASPITVEWWQFQRLRRKTPSVLIASVRHWCGSAREM
jgi:hypothetical protein